MSLSKFIRKLSKIALDSQKAEVKRVLTSFGFMSAPERGLLAALERIGLDAIRMKQENCVFPTLCTALSAGGLVFVGFINDTPRKSILGWLGVDPEMSNAEFAEVLKRIMSTVKQHSTTNKVYFQLAMRPKSGIDVDSSVLEQYLDAPLLVIEDPGTAPTLINNAVSAATKGVIKTLVDEDMCSSEIVIASAHHFMSLWEYFLEKEQVFQWELPNSSHASRFIGGDGTFKIARARSYIYIALPYGDSEVMEIYMTDNRSRLPLDLTPDEMDALREEAGPYEGTVFIPKWEDETTIEVADLLRKAHVTLKTTMEGVSAIKQKAAICVCPMATTASSAVAMVVSGFDSLADPRPVDSPITVNRPFVYAIRCESVVLYMGYIYDIASTEAGSLG